MRLLHTSSLRLEEFFQNIPRYAILSHTWSEGEVLFEDIDTNDVTRKRGWAKVKRACEIANSANYDHIWIDTCCIDKKSSAELSEAINSMYRWYAHSDICYVYLEDFQLPSSWKPATDGPFADKMSNDPSPYTALDRDLLEEFLASRWFTRGWTLQELIAPKKVLFFSSQWQPFGTRDTPALLSNISARTRIGEGVFRDKHMQSIGIGERMNWMSDRHTSRIEDQAYCLLGIFNINMPMLYGEGEGAFIRLQEAIITQIDDHSIFAWQSLPGQEHHKDAQLLARSPSVFAKLSGPVLEDSVQRGDRHTGPYHMTNQGLQITLDLLLLPKHPDDSVWTEAFALLNCEALFTGPYRKDILLPVMVNMTDELFQLRGHYKAILRKGSKVTRRVHVCDTFKLHDLAHMKFQRLPLMISSPSSQINYYQYSNAAPFSRQRETLSGDFYVSTDESISVLDQYPQNIFYRVRSKSEQCPGLTESKLGMTTTSHTWAVFLRKNDHHGDELNIVLYVYSVPDELGETKPVFLVKIVDNDDLRWEDWPWYVVHDRLRRENGDAFMKLRLEETLTLDNVACSVKQYKKPDFEDFKNLNYYVADIRSA